MSPFLRQLFLDLLDTPVYRGIYRMYIRSQSHLFVFFTIETQKRFLCDM